MTTRHYILRLFAVSVLVSPLTAEASNVKIAPPELRGASQPQVTIGPDETVHVVFGLKSKVYHTRSSDHGKTFTAPVLIAEVPKLALGRRRGPRVIATQGTIAATAISHDSGNLLAWSSQDAGKTWSSPIQINSTSTAAREGLHAMAVNDTGLAAVTWLDLRESGMELWGATSDDGGHSWSRDSRIYRSPDGHICECCHPSVAVDGKGRVAAMWRNWLGGARDMYLAISSDRGKTFGEARKLGRGEWKLNGCPMDGGAVVFTPHGDVQTVWRRESTTYVAASTETEQKLADDAMQPIVFSDRAGVAYAWQSGPRIMLQRADEPATVLTETGQFPAAAGRADQASVIAWEDGDSIFARTLN